MYGDWYWDDDFNPRPDSVFQQHEFFEDSLHPAEAALKALRISRGFISNDQAERKYIQSLKSLLGTRDKHVAEGMYWRWGLNDRQWKKLCEDTMVEFPTLVEAGRKLLAPPQGVKPASIKKWVERVLKPGKMKPTIPEAIYQGGRNELFIPSPYLLRRTPKQDSELNLLHERWAIPYRESKKSKKRDMDFKDNFSVEVGVLKALSILEAVVGNTDEFKAVHKDAVNKVESLKTLYKEMGIEIDLG